MAAKKTEISFENNGISIKIRNDTVSIYRERAATATERKRDKDAQIMSEWVHITFSTEKPQITINQDLCTL